MIWRSALFANPKNRYTTLKCDWNYQLDLESIGSSLGIDWELIWAGLDWSGPDIRPSLYTRHSIKEGHRGIRRW